MEKPILLKTERLELKELEVSHFPSIQAFASDKRVVRFMEWGPNTEEETWLFLKRAIDSQREKPRMNYELAIMSNGQVLGTCRLTITSISFRASYIGYCLRREYWELGFGSEAALALLSFGFYTLNLHRIYAYCDTENTGSIHILEKIGMKREGQLRDHKKIRGEWRDSFLYAILEEEFKEILPLS